MSNRCIPGRLYLLGESSGADSCDFSYVSLHDMADMLSPGYFLPCRDRLKHADMVRIVQRSGGGRVVAVCAAMVVQCTREFVELVPMLGPLTVPEGQMTETGRPALVAAEEYRVKRGYQCFQVINSKGTPINEYGSKAEAETAAHALNLDHAKAAA